ncbi:MAG: RNA methyltransferase, partial [Bacteroidetes bacterium GWA2_30_7]
MSSSLFEFLAGFVTDRRKKIICDNIKERTRYITVVLEDIFQPQNASAVLRTCDCFGIQDVHIIENQNKYNINPDVVLGATQWLTIKNYNKNENNTLEALNNLKKNNYRIIATTLSENNVSLNDFQLNKGKIALFFGTELTGLSSEVINNADEFLKIPMYGFTESFNISVSAGIILHDLS